MNAVANPDNDEERWVTALDAALEQSARDDLTEDEQALRAVLEDISDFYLKPDDWNSPYGPLFAREHLRSKIPEDFTDAEMHILRAVHQHLRSRPLRIRAIDILAFRSTGRRRVDGYREMVEAVTESIGDANLDTRTIHHCDRALRVALRFRGEVEEQGTHLVTALVERLFAPYAEFEPLWISEMLLKHAVARDRAVDIAAELRRLADSATLGAGRSFRSAAAGWHRAIGARGDAYDDVAWVVQNLQQEATGLLADGQPDAVLRASADLENALALLRTMPKAEREARGLAGVSDEITAAITAANARALGMMRAVRSDPIDLTDVRREVDDAVSNLPMREAIYVFLRVAGLTDYDAIKASAEQTLEDNPISRIFGVIHVSADARVTAHTNRDANELVYGVPGNVWREMVRAFQLRLGLVVGGLVAPAWMALTNDHHMQVGHFHSLTEGSPLIPPGRARVTAQALYYGYNGDFLTAAQLLAPQVENLVRVQLANSSVQTRQFDDGKQTEIGLSALMERDDIVDILGPDVAFEIRALFCSPLGPNLRNAYAHGLVGDEGQGSSAAIYAWWFVWKLIDWDFSNNRHDVAAAEAREPGTVGDDESTGTTAAPSPDAASAAG